MRLFHILTIKQVLECVGPSNIIYLISANTPPPKAYSFNLKLQLYMEKVYSLRDKESGVNKYILLTLFGSLLSHVLYDNQLKLADI